MRATGTFLVRSCALVRGRKLGEWMGARDFILIAAGMIAGVLMMSLWPSTYTYEQCMIDKMRGQPINSTLNAHAVCAAYPQKTR